MNVSFVLIHPVLSYDYFVSAYSTNKKIMVNNQFIFTIDLQGSPTTPGSSASSSSSASVASSKSPSLASSPTRSAMMPPETAKTPTATTPSDMPKTPEMAFGKDVPEWKKQFLSRKIAEKAKREEDELKVGRCLLRLFQQ